MASELSPNELDQIISDLNIEDAVEKLLDHVAAQAERIDQLETDLQGATARVAELEDELADAIRQLGDH